MPWISLEEVTLTNEFEDVVMVQTAAHSASQSYERCGGFKLCHSTPAELKYTTETRVECFAVFYWLFKGEIKMQF